jgi:hypothetical protein
MKSRRYHSLVLVGLLGGALALSGCYYYDAQGRAYLAPVQVQGQVVMGAPGPMVMDRDPDEVWLIPRSGIYFVPHISADIFFFAGGWYNHSGGHWYRGSNHRGPWNPLRDDDVPGQLRRLPPNYRDTYKYRSVPYGKWKERGYKWDDEDRDDDKGDNKGRKSWGERD